MTRLILLCGVSIVCVTAVHAADLPARALPPVVPILPFSWTGVYVGGNVGIATSDGDPVLTVGNDAVARAQFAAATVPSYFEVRQSGVAAGGQLGYNYEFGSLGGVGGGLPGIGAFGLGNAGIVVGVEADAAYTDLNHTGQFLGAEPVVNNYHQSLDYLGTVRGRAGLALDRFFVYGTGGFAYGESHYSHSILAGNDGNAVIWSGGLGGMQTGYAVGGGFEYALEASSILNPFNTNAVTVGVEFLHFDLGTRSVNLVGGLGAPSMFTDTFRTDGDIVRARLNYKFDLAPTPVVARY